MLTNEAFNALLKTLEEPPAYVIFILATTEPHKLPATVLSRCQRFDFKRINEDSMLKRLIYICEQEGINAEDEALRLIVRNSDGAMRDAISIMDQCGVYGNKNITAEDVLMVLGIVNDKYLFDMAEAILAEDISKAICLLKEMSDEGKDVSQFSKDLLMHYRNLLMAKLVEKPEEVIDLSKGIIADLKEQSNRYTRENILRCINILSNLTTELKWSSQPKVLLEVALIKMCRLEKDISTEGLLARIAKLENTLVNGEVSITAVLPAKKEKKEIKKVLEKQQDKKEPEKKEVSKVNEEKSKDTKVLDSWNGFIGEMKKRKKMVLSSHLSLCKPVLSDEDKVFLCFDRNFKTNKEAVESSKTKKEIEDIAGEYFGIPVKIKPVFEDEIQKNDAIDNETSSEENDVVKKR